MAKNTDTEVEELAPAGEREIDDSRKGVYEIGYHIVPSVTEEAAIKSAKELSDLVKKYGGEIVGDRAPVRIQLAYTIEKRVSGKRSRFNEAYFGWIAFEATAGTIEEIKKNLDADASFLRYLVVVTDKDAVAAALSGAVADVPVVGDIGKPKREAEVGGEVSEVALNQALESMASEDAKVE
ncbi:MAG: 30S ribosomal protein S6 [Patescibacteria group bacterium]|nr:30S ribosomal protein S6 [Patescibacteria group bacterium]